MNLIFVNFLDHVINKEYTYHQKKNVFMTIQPTKYEILLSEEDIKEIDDIKFQLNVLVGKFCFLRSSCTNKELIEKTTKIINILEGAEDQITVINSLTMY